jgi:HAD superfamily hydrolase (TIGR01509 family)
MSSLKGLFFDQDGVIIDAEKDGHRIAFNQTFKMFGFYMEWGVDEYHDLLQIAGGKERMKHYLHTKGFGKQIRPEDEEELIKKMHQAKTDQFIKLIESGSLPLRPGIKRLMQEANSANVLISICTTSDERAANIVARQILKDVKINSVLAGDIVTKKKPDPEIYNLALKMNGFLPSEVVVIEDSHNGIIAAKSAGLYVIATTNPYTQKEDLSRADIILTCLGDEYGEKGKLISSKKTIKFDGVLSLKQIEEYFFKKNTKKYF